MNQIDVDAWREQAEKAAGKGLVKIGLPVTRPEMVYKMEWVWAERIAPTHARVGNTPFLTTAAQLGDIVQFCEQGADDGGPHPILKSFVRVVTVGSLQVFALYGTKADMRRAADNPRAMNRMTNVWRGLRAACDAVPPPARPLAVEGFEAGGCVIAFPPSVDPAEAVRLTRKLPGVRNAVVMMRE